MIEDGMVCVENSIVFWLDLAADLAEVAAYDVESTIWTSFTLLHRKIVG